MRHFPMPTRANQFEYLLRLYFGGGADVLSSCIRRAYRDLNRTLHGLAKIPGGRRLRASATSVVRTFLTGMAEFPHAKLNQVAFDDRHRASCIELSSTYSAAGFAEFRVGQAQKWLNMALKYVFVFGEDRLPEYASVFEFAHIPLDNIILDQLSPYKVPRLTTRWSRLSSYDEYMDIQRWVRSTFPGSAPLSVEFALWQEADPAVPQD